MKLIAGRTLNQCRYELTLGENKNFLEEGDFRYWCGEFHCVSHMLIKNGVKLCYVNTTDGG
jgi:hypothetical protein